MELNYDTNCWQKPCPKVDCHKKDCCCGLSYTEIPAALEDANPPKNGAYCNAIVKYAGSGEVYIYSKEGIPVPMTALTGVGNYYTKEEVKALINTEAEARGEADETLDGKIATANSNLTTEIADRKAGDTELKTALEEEKNTRIDADIILRNGQDAEETARKSADADLQTKIDAKQNKLTAGEHITLDGDTISANLNVVLTAADANYPADAPTQVYVGFLDTGTYVVDATNRTDTFIWTNDQIGQTDLTTHIIVGEPFTNRTGQTVKPITLINAGSIGVPPYINFYADTGGASVGDIIKGTLVADDLTTTANPNWVALSAKQGKILNDKIGG